MYSLPSLRSSKERGALPRRKPWTSTFCTNLRYAFSEAFSISSQVISTSRTASLFCNVSTETFTFPPTLQSSLCIPMSSRGLYQRSGAGDGDRTRDFLLGKEMLYH